MPAQLRQRHRDELLALTDRLIAEYAGLIAAGTVIRIVSRCHEHLLRAGVREGLTIATEAGARTRLRSIIPAHAVG